MTTPATHFASGQIDPSLAAIEIMGSGAAIVFGALAIGLDRMATRHGS